MQIKETENRPLKTVYDDEYNINNTSQSNSKPFRSKNTSNNQCNINEEENNSNSTRAKLSDLNSYLIDFIGNSKKQAIYFKRAAKYI